MRPIKARVMKFGDSNELRVTLSGLIWSAAQRDWPFFRPAALSQAHVQQAHIACKALQEHKNGRIDAIEISVNRP